MAVPDVMGYTLGEARTLLDNAGINVNSIKVTAPPRMERTELGDFYRVVSQSMIDDKNVELVVVKI